MNKSIKINATNDELIELIKLYKSLIIAEHECTALNISLLMSQNHYSETLLKFDKKKRLNGDVIIKITKKINNISKNLNI